MKHPYMVSVDADPATIKPLGDFVLVKKVSDVDLEQRYKNLIIIPAHRQGPGDWVPQIGRVVAVGPGDGLLFARCRSGCDDESMPHGMLKEWVASNGAGVCSECGSRMELIEEPGRPGFAYASRAPMHVSIGDQIIYARWPDNDVEIRGEQYSFLHEEQAILAVVDRECESGMNNEVAA